MKPDELAFAVGNDVAQVGGGRGSRSERWPAEEAALGGFAVTLCAVLWEDGVRGEDCVSRRRLGGDSGKCK
jgi:hypothetical protein